jgi:uncharacterized membrane protein YfcA
MLPAAFLVLTLISGPGMIVGYSLAGRLGEVLGALVSVALVAAAGVRLLRRRWRKEALARAIGDRPDPFVRRGGGR